MSAFKTDVIRYNISERGRKHTGKPRRFDTLGLKAIIDSAALQERVKNRDMAGYFGHWPRLVFGMMPAEGGIVDGRQVTVEPAFITTRLTCDAAGNIEHEAEFRDNAPGRAAWRLYSQKQGGFSSAIDARPRNGVDMPLAFYGFDYVLEPNYTTNRGYSMALDSVGADGVELILDTASRDSALAVQRLDGMYSELQTQYDNALAAMQALERENAEMKSLLASSGRAGAVLDNVFQRPIVMAAHGSDLRDLITGWSGAERARYETENESDPDKTGEAKRLDGFVRDVIKQRFGS